MKTVAVILFSVGCVIVAGHILKAVTEWRGDTRRHTRRWK